MLMTSLLTLILTPGCGAGSADAPGGATDGSDATTGGATTGATGGADPYQPTSDGGHRITGAVTWTLDFDAEAEAAGYQDCEYTREYTGDEVRDQPYLCADCTLMFSGTAVMTAGHDDCYSQISSGDVENQEYWGFGQGEVAASGFYRSSLTNYPLGLLGDLDRFDLDTDLPLSWESADNALDTGKFALYAAGSARFILDEGYTPADAEAVREGTYSCGWPTNNPGTLSSDDIAADDAVMPAGLFEDDCGEEVSLWDFYGSYLILDSAQPDCGPCQDMSADAADGLAAMRAEGMDVLDVTLLGAGLSYVFDEPDDATWDAWLGRYDEGEPILRDRGYGYAVLAPYLGGASYPSWAILRPDMTLLYAGTGYGATTWGAIADLIRADMGG